MVAFVLFGALMAIRAAFSMGIDVAGADRLMMIHKVSIIQPLPRSYGDRIRATEGVTALSHANWFGGYYQEPSNFVQSMAVDPESWLAMYPEFEVPADQKKAWFGNRIGAVIGVDLAKRLQLEDRRSRAVARAYLRGCERRPLGVHDRGHLRFFEAGRRQDAVLLSLRVPERDDAKDSRHGGRRRVVRAQGRRSGHVRSARQAYRRDVRQLVG